MAGHRGTGFLLAGTVGGNQEIIAGPGSWQFQGYQFLGDGRDVRAPGAWGMAVLRQALVSAPGTRPHTSMPVQQAAEAHRQLESGTVHQRIILTLE